MEKSIKYFIIIIYLIPVFVFSQSFYSEVGLNSFNKIQYESPDETESNSTSPRSRVEIGLMLSSSKKLMPYIGLSQEKFAFNIKHNQSNHKLKSLIETNYFGINFGANYLAYTKKNLKIFGSSGLSTNFLTGGMRTDVLTLDDSYSSSTLNNLMQDNQFSKVRYNLLLGFTFDYSISKSASIYTNYKFNNSLRIFENNKESYQFTSHVISLGVRLRLDKLSYKREQIQNNNLIDSYQQPSIIDLVSEKEVIIDSLGAEAKIVDIQVVDSTRIKVYFPSHSNQFYANHTTKLNQIANVLLNDTTLRYKITCYYDALTSKNDAQKRVESIKEHFMSFGLLEDQFVVKFEQENDPYSTATNIWNRRIELVMIK